MSVGNTRPIDVCNSRGRAYRCNKCPTNHYMGERSKVFQHFYRKHVAIDQVPFYCSICKFITLSRNELENHTKPAVYPAHAATVKAMLQNGETVNEIDSLLQNMKHYIISENDVTRLGKEESCHIFSQRKRDKNNDSNVKNTSILQEAAIISGIDTKSEGIEDILPQMLNGADLTPFSLPEDPFVSKPFNINLTAVKSPNNNTLSTASNTSPYKGSCVSIKNDCDKCLTYEQENKMLKNDVHTMGIVLEQVLIEMKEIKEMIKDVKKDTNQSNIPSRPQHCHKGHFNNYSTPRFNRDFSNHKFTQPKRQTISLDPYQKRINTHIRF